MNILKKILSSPYKTVLILVVITVMIHCLAFSLQNIIQRDSVCYIETAKELLNPDMKRNFSHQMRAPLLPMMIAFGHYCGMGFEAAGILFVIITSSFIPLAIFMIAKEIFKDNEPALLAAMLAAIHPFFIRMGSYILRDPLYWTCLAFAVAFSLIAIRKRENFKYLIYWAIAGFFSVLAMSLRKEGLELILFVLLWLPVELLLHCDKFKEELLRVALSAIVFLAVVYLVCSLIYYYYTICLNGTWNMVYLDLFPVLFSRFLLIFT